MATMSACIRFFTREDDSTSASAATPSGFLQVAVSNAQSHRTRVGILSIRASDTPLRLLGSRRGFVYTSASGGTYPTGELTSGLSVTRQNLCLAVMTRTTASI